MSSNRVVAGILLAFGLFERLYYSVADRHGVGEVFRPRGCATRRRNLIQQGLKQMEIDRSMRVPRECVLKRLGFRKAAKPSPNDDDVPKGRLAFAGVL
jgi:hypothetical protein